MSAGSAKLKSPPTLQLTGPQGQEIELKAGTHFATIGLSGTGQVSAPLVFAGYGATATTFPYDDYKDMDGAGKVVILVRKAPRFGNRNAPFDDDLAMHHAGLETKLVNAELHRAAAVLIVNDRDSAKNGDTLMDFRYTAQGAGSTDLPALHVSRSVVNTLLHSATGTTLEEIEADIDRDLKPRGVALAGWNARLETNVERPKVEVKNVIGVLEGAGPLAKETVIIGAHYDHLGYGGPGSLARDLKQPTIHHGADDNGSGTTTVLELARRFGQMANRQGRRLVFITFTGEESGLLGSIHYCKNPVFPLSDTVTMINLDMVGRLTEDKDAKKDKLIVYGTGTSKTFSALMDSLNKKYDFKLQKVPGGTGPSDHQSFYLKGVPVFFFFTGDHKDYHKPSDTADKINVVGMRRVADLTEELAQHLMTVAERPNYVKVASDNSRPRGGGGPRLGIQPAYGDDKEGVLLQAVTEGGPADKAGLKEGDRIVELGGKSVKNVETYMVLMAGYKRGDTIEVGIVRDGKKMMVKVTP
jgi:Zn-dependent M28 family amino/carboxypeptidase